jgi:conjugal transfer pilus assembly protein TraA
MSTAIVRFMHIGAIAVFVSCFLLIALMPDLAHAGVGGAAFDEVWDTLVDWTQGTLGKIIAGAMVLVGIVSGVARQSLMAFAIGIGGGMGLYYTPDVIETVVGATLLIG